MLMTRACPAGGLARPMFAPRPLPRTAPPYAARSGLCWPRSSRWVSSSSSSVRVRVGPAVTGGPGDTPGAARREERAVELMTASFAAAAKAQQGAEVTELAARVRVLESVAVAQQLAAAEAARDELAARVRVLEAAVRELKATAQQQGHTDIALTDPGPRSLAPGPPYPSTQDKHVKRIGLTVRPARSEDERALLAAAKEGALPEMERLLSKPTTNPDAQDENGDAALHGAGWNGQTALHWASYNGHTEAVQALLRAGADVTAKNDVGESALHSASYNGHTKAVEVLLRAGADVAATNDLDDTALHYASDEGHKEAVEVLLRAGADVASKNDPPVLSGGLGR
ncbi:Ankyrin repeat domain-containing protein [Tetrabaena socialis]|uniref:Ankyrin repeat domain-containing protein n=1 Tax=Tetrabaena socialis TaxID=47790 RepID=A0A2J8A7N1_9CHLO|nr:Ankyrin repeat domain-containing protein [Tetrabaena socialis]|eukprot:PNH08527.1 Ankyrin repeat domain-containing protein [Tetrabaena socialis]